MGTKLFWILALCFSCAAADPPASDTLPRHDPAVDERVAGDLGGQVHSSGALIEALVNDLLSENDQTAPPDATNNWEFKTFLVTTFADMSRASPILGDVVYVVVYPPGDKIAAYPMADDFETSRKLMGYAAKRIKVTAIILVTQDQGVEGKFGIRWFGDSGTEYNICGHGNAGAGACLHDSAAPSSTMSFTSDFRERDLEIKVLQREAVPLSDGTRAVEMEVTQTIGQLSEFRGGLKRDEVTMKWVKENMLGNSDGVVKGVWEAAIGVVVQVGTLESVKDIERDTLCSNSDQYPLDQASPYKAKTASDLRQTATGRKQVDGWIFFFLEPATTGPQKVKYRAFYPQLGVCEDKVTGSAFALTSASAHEHVVNGTTEFRGEQISLDGGEAAGVVSSLVTPKTGDIATRKIKITGKCVRLRDNNAFSVVRALTAVPQANWRERVRQWFALWFSQASASASSAALQEGSATANATAATGGDSAAASSTLREDDAGATASSGRSGRSGPPRMPLRPTRRCYFDEEGILQPAAKAPKGELRVFVSSEKGEEASCSLTTDTTNQQKVKYQKAFWAAFRDAVEATNAGATLPEVQASTGKSRGGATQDPLNTATAPVRSALEIGSEVDASSAGQEAEDTAAPEDRSESAKNRRNERAMRIFRDGHMALDQGKNDHHKRGSRWKKGPLAALAEDGAGGHGGDH